MARKPIKRHQVTRNGKTFWRGKGSGSAEKSGSGKEFEAKKKEVKKDSPAKKEMTLEDHEREYAKWGKESGEKGSISEGMTMSEIGEKASHHARKADWLKGNVYRGSGSKKSSPSKSASKPKEDAKPSGKASKKEGGDTISKEEWNKTHKDFKSVIGGQKYIMKWVPGDGTSLVPVNVGKKKK